MSREQRLVIFSRSTTIAVARAGEASNQAKDRVSLGAYESNYVPKATLHLDLGIALSPGNPTN